MTVFISYRHTDRVKALEINNRLRKEGVETYFDVLDIESQSTNDITNVITNNIKKSSHLLAVVSTSTSLSWWVPFEIGEATITNRRICTFHNGFSELPEYLEKWPKLKSMNDLELFISEYNKESSQVRAGVENFSTNASQILREAKNAELFHDSLKARIRKGF